MRRMSAYRALSGCVVPDSSRHTALRLPHRIAHVAAPLALLCGWLSACGDASTPNDPSGAGASTTGPVGGSAGNTGVYVPGGGAAGIGNPDLGGGQGPTGVGGNGTPNGGGNGGNGSGAGEGPNGSTGGGTAGQNGGGGGDNTPPVPVDAGMIDDFEDGDQIILDRGERVGQWSAYNDGSPGSSQSPAAGQAVKPEMGGANGTTYAVHTSGQGFADWGAGIQFDLQNTGNGASARKPYNASQYSGIQFYARGSGSVRLELPISATTPASSGGTCAADCSNSHGLPLTLTSEWKLINVPFDVLAQEEGWGAAANFDSAGILGLAFKAVVPDGGTADFDFWIDELRFATDAELAGLDVEDAIPTMNEYQDPTSTAGMCSNDLGGYANNNGSVTWYTFDQGSTEVNCSYSITGRNPDRVATIKTGDGTYFGAINTADYNAAAMCGACVEVTRDNSRSVVITVVDQCPIGSNPKCTAGHIDLSRAAFLQLGAENEGYLGQGNPTNEGGAVGNISWKYVPCPTSDNVSFKLKEPDNKNWNQLLVQGHPYAIESVEINGKPAARQAHNYWEPPEGDMGLEPFYVKVTDINGSVITASVPREGGDIDSGVKLSCQ